MDTPTYSYIIHKERLLHPIRPPLHLIRQPNIPRAPAAPRSKWFCLNQLQTRLCSQPVLPRITCPRPEYKTTGRIFFKTFFFIFYFFFASPFILTVLILLTSAKPLPQALILSEISTIQYLLARSLVNPDKEKRRGKKTTNKVE
ncbi:hypothetical protein BDW59DRAFT_113692 [Aspergillus cavernicola]|uniref:Uncharacterized protein n=1 Tax=Aspergillus cavernicola TaxID=176166 RepID=A0ABR4HYG8_9EURO